MEAGESITFLGEEGVLLFKPCCDDQLPLGLVIRDLTEILFVQSMIFPSQIHGAVAMQIPAEGDELFRLEVHYRKTNISRLQDLQREYGTSFTTAQF